MSWIFSELFNSIIRNDYNDEFEVLVGIDNCNETLNYVYENEFPSNFKNRPVPEGISSSIKIPEKSKATKMMVLSDGDFFKNQVNKSDGSPYPLGFDRFMPDQQYANKSFLLNTVDYLVDDSGIIGLRNKEIKLRLLDRAKIRQEKTFWQLINIILPLFVIFLSGIFQHYYRIRKYTR
jgi:ABC-2 type transport system permease protein